MPIRTGRLWKKCIKCKKMFEPEGRSKPKICQECFASRYERREILRIKDAKPSEAWKVLTYRKLKKEKLKKW